MLDSPIWIPTIFHIVTDLSAYYQDRTVLGHALMLVSEKNGILHSAMQCLTLHTTPCSYESDMLWSYL